MHFKYLLSYFLSLTQLRTALAKTYKEAMSLPQPLQVCVIRIGKGVRGKDVGGWGNN